MAVETSKKFYYFIVKTTYKIKLDFLKRLHGTHFEPRTLEMYPYK